MNVSGTTRSHSPCIFLSSGVSENFRVRVECDYETRRFALLVPSHQPVVRWEDSMRYRESFRSRVRRKKTANPIAPITICESGWWPMISCIISMDSCICSITNVLSLSQEAGPCAASVGYTSMPYAVCPPAGEYGSDNKHPAVMTSVTVSNVRRSYKRTGMEARLKERGE